MTVGSLPADISDAAVEGLNIWCIRAIEADLDRQVAERLSDRRKEDRQPRPQHEP